MSFRKINSIRVSESVFDLVCSGLDDYKDDGVKISGYLQTFNNCREQGYVLTVYSTYNNKNKTEKDLYIWVFEARNSDEIVVVNSTNYPMKGMFSDDDYENRTYFQYHERYNASEFIIVDLVKAHFKTEFYELSKEYA